MRQPWSISGLIKSLHTLLTGGEYYRPERHYMRGPGPAWCAKHKQGRLPR